MKKYLSSLIPVIFCTILSIVYAVKTPKNYPDSSYPYQTEGTLAYLSTGWFYIGIVVSGIFISMFIINDIYNYIEKLIEKKKMNKLSNQG